MGVDTNGFFDAMVVGPSVSELIALGRLAEPVVYAPKVGVDLSGVKKRGGDYVTSQLAAAVDRSAVTGDAVTHYRKFCDGQSAVAFTVTTDHAGHVVEQFKAASYALAMQQIGRALRVYPGKDKAIILDHADNVRRHGLPTDEVEWSLDGAKRKKDKPLLKSCFKCDAVIELAAKVCPGCGQVFEKLADRAVESAGGGEVKVREGELVEMTPEMVAQIRQRKKQEFVSARTREQLVVLGEQRNYKNPEFWAGKVLEERRHGGELEGL